MMWGVLIPDWLKRAGAIVVAAVAGIGLVWVAWRRSVKNAVARKETKDYVDTRKRIDDSRNADTDGSDLDWLRDYGDQ